jgi:hypothetical protein
MLRLSFLLSAVALFVGSAGCTHCDTCDDFPIPCVGGNCGSAGMAMAPMTGAYTGAGASNAPYAPEGPPTVAPLPLAPPPGTQILEPLPGAPDPAMPVTPKPADTTPAAPSIPKPTTPVNPPIPPATTPVPGAASTPPTTAIPPAGTFITSPFSRGATAPVPTLGEAGAAIPPLPLAPEGSPGGNF